MGQVTRQLKAAAGSLATTRTAGATLVVPCFNEAARLHGQRFLGFVRSHPHVRFVFVDDGSRDDTATRLQALVDADPIHFELLRLPSNRGQGEAVRAGVRHAFSRGDDYVGYWDADLAAPLSEIPRFIAALEDDPQCDAVFGSRVPVLGSVIERRLDRLVLGRLFAFAARRVLRHGVYDTQCGAKLFRRTAAIEAIFDAPFRARWVFDVELLGRFLCDTRDPSRVRELPLRAWRDVAGTKLRVTDFLEAPLLLLRIRGDLRAREARRAGFRR